MTFIHEIHRLYFFYYGKVFMSFAYFSFFLSDFISFIMYLFYEFPISSHRFIFFSFWFLLNRDSYFNEIELIIFVCSLCLALEILCYDS